MTVGLRYLLWSALLAACTASAAPAGTANANLPSLPSHPMALNSYLQPPFVTPGLAGVADVFVALLNQQLPADLQHGLENVPRRRLTDGYLSRGDFRGVALFLSPNFIAPGLNDRVHWSRPILVDENLLVTRGMPAPKAWADLRGRTLGGVLGHIYRPLAPLIERGELQREDAADHVSNVGRLCLGRVDLIVMSRSEFQVANLPAGCSASLTAVSMPEPDVFSRAVLIAGPASYDAQIMQAVETVACGPAWHREAAARRLSVAPCHEAAR
jgi:polar amino acid transport system substrate-binding protein